MAIFDPSELSKPGSVDRRRIAAIADRSLTLHQERESPLGRARVALSEAVRNAEEPAEIDLSGLTKEQLVGLGLAVLSARAGGVFVFDPFMTQIVDEFNARPAGSSVMLPDGRTVGATSPQGLVRLPGKPAVRGGVETAITGDGAVRRARVVG